MVSDRDCADEDADLMLRSMLPTGFGKQSAEEKRNVDRSRATVARLDRARRNDDRADASSDSDEIGPPIPVAKPETASTGTLREPNSANGPPGSRNKTDDSDSESEEYSDDEDNDDIPATHELVLKDHTRSVSALTMDADGERLFSGAHDYTVRIWEFKSIRPGAPRPIAVVDPTEVREENVGRYPVRNLDFCTEDAAAATPLLFVRSATKPQLLTRDGAIVAEFASGDPYIRDLRTTRGHIAELTHGVWRPRQALFATTSADGTARLWDPQRTRQQLEVLVLQAAQQRAAGAARIRIDSCCWSPLTRSGMLALAAEDGSLSLWQPGQSAGRVQQRASGAFCAGSNASSIAFASDGNRLALRATDDTIALWDVRSFKQPLMRISVPCSDDRIEVLFSPDGRFVLTGCTKSSSLTVLRSADLSIVRQLRLSPEEPGAHPVRIFWHPKINQIAVSSSNGQINVLFSPKASLRGASDVITRAAPRRHIDDVEELTMNIEPVPVDQRRGTSGRWRQKNTKDYSFTPEYVEQLAPSERQLRAEAEERKLRGKDIIAEDPREALLKYDDKAKHDPIFTKLYSKTQPKKIFSEKSRQHDQDDPYSETKRQKLI